MKIVVRTEAEKLMLLTALANANETLNGTKSEHDKIDFVKYADRITIDSEFFFYGSIMPELLDGKFRFVYTEKDGQKIQSYDDIILNVKEEQYSIRKQKNIIVRKLSVKQFEITDVNNNKKCIGKINCPGFILSMNKWYGNRVTRYYSTIYLSSQDKVYRIYRNVNENIWYNSLNNKIINLPEKIWQKLREVEDSIEEN
ncbi:hypothetical protein AB9M75_07585 [Lactobacillus sp. AN1001]